jgi:hypothetical protein
VTLKGERIAQDFETIVADYVRATYGGEPAAAHLRPERKSIAIRESRPAAAVPEHDAG